MISGIGNVNQAPMMRPPQGEPPAPEEVFAELDTDGSGTLDEAELQAMIERMEARRPEGAEPPDGKAPDPATMLADLDTDGDGVLSQAEFAAGRPEGPPPPPPRSEEAVAATDEESELQMRLLALFEIVEGEDATGVLA